MELHGVEMNSERIYFTLSLLFTVIIHIIGGLGLISLSVMNITIFFIELVLVTTVSISLQYNIHISNLQFINVKSSIDSPALSYLREPFNAVRRNLYIGFSSISGISSVAAFMPDFPTYLYLFSLFVFYMLVANWRFKVASKMTFERAIKSLNKSKIVYPSEKVPANI